MNIQKYKLLGCLDSFYPKPILRLESGVANKSNETEPQLDEEQHLD